jgi:hypothetical protein
MRAMRIVSLISLFAVGLAGSAAAQRITDPGTYTVKICVAPGFLPQGGAELPPDLQNIGPDVYEGTLTVSRHSSGAYRVTYRGERSDGARLRIAAQFESDWGGFLLGSLPVGGSTESDCLTGIDVANLISARISGIGTIDGRTRRLQAVLGAGGTFERHNIRRAPGPFRND